MNFEIKNNVLVKYKGNEETVVIPDGVTTISSGAFYRCKSLKEVIIPNSVTEIEEDAFMGCSSIEHIILPSQLVSIGHSAFSGCVSLKSIVIPHGVKSIEDMAFYGCTSLADITIPDDVKGIYGNAFKGTAYYNDANNYENNALYIGNHLIKARDYISGNYCIREGTKTIADDAFRYCQNLEKVTIPNSVTYIGITAFYGCSSLKRVKMSTNVTEIESYAFGDCTSLEEITIPNGVKVIRYQTFVNCESLESVIIPDSVTKIEEEAFKNCPSLIITLLKEEKACDSDIIEIGDMVKIVDAGKVYTTHTEWIMKNANEYAPYFMYNHTPNQIEQAEVFTVVAIASHSKDNNENLYLIQGSDNSCYLFGKKGIVLYPKKTKELKI